MNDQNDDDNSSVDSKIKIVSYLITLFFPIFAGAGISNAANDFLGIVSGVVLFLLLSLSNVRSTLYILVEEIPVLFKAIRRYLSRADTKSISQSVHNYLHFVHMSLFKPIQFGCYFFDPQNTRWSQSNLKIIGKISTLFLLNSLLIVTARIYINGLTISLFIDKLVLWFLFPAGLLFFLWSDYKPKILQKVPSLSESAWFFIIIPWAEFISDFNFTESLSTFLYTFIFIFAIGCATGVSRNVRMSGRSFLSWGLFWALILTTFGIYMIIEEPTYSRIESDQYLLWLTNFYEETLYDRQLNQDSEDVVTDQSSGLQQEVNQNNDFSSTGNTNTYNGLSNSIRYAYLTIALIATCIGWWLGAYGYLIWILEAPIFYVAWLLMELGQVEHGKKLSKAIICFDEWRIATWPGEGLFYKRNFTKTSDEIIYMLSSEIFFTARSEDAFYKITSIVLKKKPEIALQILLPLLPFIETEQEIIAIHPSANFLFDKPLDETFEMVKMHRLNLFKEMETFVNNNSNIDSSHSIYLRAFHYLGIFNIDQTLFSSPPNSKSYEKSLEQILFIVTGLEKYKDLASVKPIYEIAVATKKSLLIENAYKICTTFVYWEHLHKILSPSQEYIYLVPIAQHLLNMASILENLHENGHAKIGQAAIYQFDIQNRLEELITKQHLGIKFIPSIIKHWDILLRNYLKQFPLEP